MPMVKCNNCGAEVYKKPSHIQKNKHKRFYCNNTCKGEHFTKLRILELEEKAGQNLKEYLIQKYLEEEKTVTWLMNELDISSHFITDLLKRYNIKTRSDQEQYEVWWSKLSEKEKEEYIEDIRKRNSTNLHSKKSRDKLRKVMSSKEYREKISKANSGTNNGMYDPTLTEEHRIETRGLFGYKKWALKVKERDNFTCEKCNKKGNSRTIHAHHINDYFEYEDDRLDLDNGISLCNSCHNKFHNRYKGQNATEELLNEFMKS